MFGFAYFYLLVNVGHFKIRFFFYSFQLSLPSKLSILKQPLIKNTAHWTQISTREYLHIRKVKRKKTTVLTTTTVNLSISITFLPYNINNERKRMTCFSSYSVALFIYSGVPETRLRK